MSRSPRSRLLLPAAIGLIALSVGAGWALGVEAGIGSPRPVTPREPLPEAETATVRLFENASPSVVFISRYELWGNPFFSRRATEIHAGTGTGFVWDRDGHIVTNFHVADGARRLLVTLHDQSTYEAEVVGTYADKDLAVLRIDVPDHRLRPLPIGTSRDLRVGQSVYAIGNPFGLDQSLSTGVVSALSREMTSPSGRPIKDVIQTDAAINPGNSGGPLLDSAGRLIGVNTMIVSSSGSSAGIGFAVPVSVVNRVVPQIVATGSYYRPGLGVGLMENAFTRRFYDRGVMISSVATDSAAARAGLIPTRRSTSGQILLGDVIIAVDGIGTQDAESLVDRLEGYDVGDKVILRVLREDEPTEIPVVLQPLRTTR